MTEKTTDFLKRKGTGRHIFRYKGERITVLPGQRITVPASVLGSFVKEYDVVGGSTEFMEVVKEDIEKGTKNLELVPKKGGYFDVINPDNPEKPLNAVGLRKKEALKLISDLEGTEDPDKKKRTNKDKFDPYTIEELDQLDSLSFEDLFALAEFHEVNIADYTDDPENMDEVELKSILSTVLFDV